MRYLFTIIVILLVANFDLFGQVSGATTACSGVPESYSAGGSGGYSWSISGGSIVGGGGPGDSGVDVLWDPGSGTVDVSWDDGAGDTGSGSLNVDAYEALIAGANDTQSICSGSASNYDLEANMIAMGNVEAISSYNWYVVTDNPNVTGETLLPSWGTIGSITDVLTNTSSVDQQVVYNVDPTSVNGCAAPTLFTITITIEPLPSSGIAISASATTVCYETGTNIQVAGSEVGVSYQLRDNADDTPIGIPVVGTGGTINLPTGNLTSYPSKTFNVIAGVCAVELAQTVTVNIEFLPTGGDWMPTVCSGQALNVDLQLNAFAFASAPPSTFVWTAASNPNVSGESTTPQATAFITDMLVNTTPNNEDVIYTISATSIAAGCVGNSWIITATVRPKPVLSPSLNAVVCSGSTSGIFLDTDGVSVSASSYNITSISIGSGLVADGGNAVVPGSGVAAAYIGSDIFTNTTGSPATVTYNVVPVSFGCQGNSVAVVLTINPQPVGGNENTSICSGDNFFYDLQTNINVLGNSLTSTFFITSVLYGTVTGGSVTPGAATVINENLVNSFSTPAVVTYTVVPTSAAGCSGSPFNVTATVKPIPNLSISNSSPSIASGATTNIALTNPNSVAGTTYSWTVSAPLISGASAGGGNSISQVLTNSSGSTQTAQYTITPQANGCANTPQMTSVDVATAVFSGTVITADSVALVALYNATNGAGWTNKTNWLTGPVNTWFGVTVTSSRVSNLALLNNNLVGTIPPQIGNLTGLGISGGNTGIRFASNQLTGTIPTEIGNLTSLVILRLESNQLSGSIPAELGNLPAIKYILLQNNQLTGSIPTQLTQATALVQLELNNNLLSDLPDFSALSSFSFLNTFRVENNNLTFEDIQPNIGIPEITYSPQKQITPKPNQLLTLGDPLSISYTVGGTGNLYQWYKGGNPISGANANTFGKPSVVLADTGRYFLRVTNPAAALLTLQTGNTFVSLIGVNPSDSLALVALYNSTNGPGWTNKTNWLTGYVVTWNGITVTGTRVTGINLAGNKLAGPIPVAVGDLTNLTLLNLDNNQLTGSVPTTFNNLDALTQLQLGGNSLVDLPNLTGMASITSFNITSNFFTFEDLQPNVAITGISYCCQKQLPQGSTIPVTIGGPLNLSATVGGTGNVYQWKKYGAPITGAASNTYALATTTISDAGNYYLEITNPGVPGLTLQTTDFAVQIKSLLSGDDSGYAFLKKLGAELLGVTHETPVYIAVGSSGNMHVQYSSNNTIVKYDNAGNFISSFSVPAPSGGQDISVDGSDAVYITDEGTNKLVKYDASGNVVYTIPNTDGTYGNTLDPSGNILFLPRQTQPFIIRKHNSINGAFIGSIPLTSIPTSPSRGIYLDIDTDAAGNIYAIEPSVSVLDKFSSTGAYMSTIDLTAAGFNAWYGFRFIVAANNDIYVQSINWWGGSATYHFNSAGTFVGTFGNDFSQTTDVAQISSGIVVPNYDYGLTLFDLNGNFLNNLGPQKNANGEFNALKQIASNSKGFRYVVDRNNHRVQKFNAAGNWISTFGTFGTGNGQFNQPGSIAIDKSDNIYVTDNNNNRVQKFNPTGTHILTIGSAGSGNGQFANPVSVVVSKAGKIVVADKGNSRVQIFNSNGTFVSTFGTVGTGQGQFTNLQTVAIEADGTILAADGQARLQRFTNLGVFVSELNMYGPVTSIPQITTDIDGFMYMPTGGVVKKFDKNGGLITDIGLSPATLTDGTLRSVSVSSNLVGDTLWIADNTTTNRISVFTANFRKSSAADSLALVDLYKSTKGATWTVKTNWLTGLVHTWYGVKMSSGKIRGVNLAGNNLNGPLPATITTLDNLIDLNLFNNKITGSVPDWSLASALIDLDLSKNLLAGVTTNLPQQLQKLDLSDNQLTDVPTLPSFIIGADLSNNKISQLGNLPPTHSNLDTLLVQNNKLTFEDLEPNISIPAFTYSPQDSVDVKESVLKQLNDTQTFTAAIGGTANVYQWRKNGTSISGAINAALTLPNITFNDDAVYRYEATNTIVTGLTLKSRDRTLRVSSLKRDSIALRSMYNSTDGPNWTNKSNWLTTPLGTGNWFGITIANNRVAQVNLPNNNLKGPIAAIVADIQNLVSLNLSNNKITSLPDLTSYPAISTLNVSGNKLDFASLEKNASITGINYLNQADLGTPFDKLVDVGEPVKFKLITGGTTNSYQWKRNGTVVAGATDSTYQITAIGRSNMGDYICEVTNPKVPGLALKSTLQRAKAVATISGMLSVNATTPVTKGQMTLLKINPIGQLYDTTQLKSVKSDGSYALEKVVLDDYILVGQGDTVLYREYFPTYYNGSIFWEKATVIKLNENRSDVNYSLVALPTVKPKGVGEISGIFENELPGGRVENRGRVSGASATVRRQQTTGRPSPFGRTMSGDEIVAFVYTDENGEFIFDHLEEGSYLLNLQYPGVPMDPKSDIVITIGSAEQKQDKQKVSALAIDGKIVVTRLVIVGVNEEEQQSVQIYPNPTSSTLYIQLAEGSGAGHMKLFDRTGREVMTRALPEGRTTLDLSEFSAGIYLLKTYRLGKEVSAARILVE